MIRKLIYFGNKLLREKCEPVGIVDDEARDLASDLIDTLDEMRGAGLAAPQIGIMKRMFVICYVGQNSKDEPILGEPIVYIDPVITVTSDKEWTYEEGCLSIPGMFGGVTRPYDIDVEYTTLDGKRVKEQAYGWKARCILHENDHLNGVLYLDRMDKQERQGLEPKLRLLKKRLG